jgi:type I restriction enzyme S subunit
MSSRPGFKQTEIGEIPEEWVVCRIGESCDVRTGGTPSMNHPEYFGGNIKWIRSGDIHKKRIFDVDGRITVEGMKNSNAKMLPINSVLIAMNGRGKTRATVAILKTEATCNQSLAAIIPRSDIHPEYLMYHLENRYNELRNLTGDNDRSGLNLRIISDLLVAIPELLEQKKIATILSTVDDAIQKTDEIIAKTKRLKKGLMQKLLTRGIGHTKFKQTEIGEIPEEWEVVKLERILEGRLQYGLTASAIDQPRGPRFLRTTDIKDNKVDWNSLMYCECSEQDITKYRLRAGDVIVARAGSYGVSILIEQDADIVYGSYMIRLHPNHGVMDPKYLACFMQSEIYWRQIRRESAGSTLKNINTATLKRLFVPLPSLPEQKKIATVLSTVDEQIEKERAKKGQLEQLKKGLMQILLTGKVRVKVN